MEENTEPTEFLNENQEELFNTWANNYNAISTMWDKSYEKLYKPLAESTEEIFTKAIDISKEATPDKYKNFYDEWTETYQKTFGKMFPVPSDKESLEAFQSFSNESNKLISSWTSQLEENSKKSREILKGKPDSEKLQACYDMWMNSYEKMFGEILELPTMESTKKIFENYEGIPETYKENLDQIAKHWKNSYGRLYGPWMESLFRLSGKIEALSKGEAKPENYKEFYDSWTGIFKDIYGRYSKEGSMEIYENFMESTNLYLNMHKSWITALERMSNKANEMYKQTVDVETYKEFNSAWMKMYEKAFDSFITGMPMFSPLKEMINPAKNASKIYSDFFTNMSKLWAK